MGVGMVELLLVLMVEALLSIRGQAGDPEITMTAMELIQYHGYRAEEYSANTSDGYVLGVHRIPCPRSAVTDTECYKPRPVVFLQHCLLCSSSNWLTNLVNESFAYLLADQGFDVWMGNVRGNTYSRHHEWLSPDDEEFWKFSFDEHALIDLPCMIDKALTVSQQSDLYYVGHSQGTLMGFAGFTHNKTLASRIKKFFALAPVAYVKHISGLFSVLAHHYHLIEDALDKVGDGEFLPNEKIMDVFADLFCDSDIKEICGDILFIICGFDTKNLNESRIPVYVAHTPAGTSLQNVIHWAQMVKSGNFVMYDYEDVQKNMGHYGMPHPPAYNLTELDIPTALFTGGHDWLADPIDVQTLLSSINHTVFFFNSTSYYEHLDFIWGVDAANIVYNPIIKLIWEDLKKKS